MKKKDSDKAGISTGTTKIEGMGHGSAGSSTPGKAFGSTAKSQKPTAGGTQSVSRGQKIRN